MRESAVSNTCREYLLNFDLCSKSNTPSCHDHSLLFSNSGDTAAIPIFVQHPV